MRGFSLAVCKTISECHSHGEFNPNFILLQSNIEQMCDIITQIYSVLKGSGNTPKINVVP